MLPPLLPPSLRPSSPPLPLGSIALTGDRMAISGIHRVKRFKCVGVVRSGQACGRSCMRACMYALSYVSVHRSPSVSKYSLEPGPGFTSKPSPRSARCGFFVAVGLFCTTSRCLSGCLSFCLGLSNPRPPPVLLKDHLTWMRLLTQPPSDAAVSDSLGHHFLTLLLTGGGAEARLGFQQPRGLAVRVR